MYAIVNVDRHWGIGRGGRLLLRLPPDMRRFRAMTLGKTVVMGRKTFESLPGGTGLPGRRNLVLSRGLGRVFPGAEAVPSVEALLTETLKPGEEAFVIGGAEVYKRLLPYCDTAYVTKMDADFGPADAWFPRLDEAPDWEAVRVSDWEDYGGTRFCYAEYRRVQG